MPSKRSDVNFAQRIGEQMDVLTKQNGKSGKTITKAAFCKLEQKEMVNHPAHYGGDTVYEVIKVLEAWGLDRDFLLGNSVKYIARSGRKNEHELEDLKKAAWYLNRRIERLENAEKSTKHKG